MEGLFSAFTLLQASPAVAEAPSGAPTANVWLLGIIALCVLTIPFLLGTLVAGALRMKDIAFRLSLVFFVTALSLTPFIYSSVSGEGLLKAIPLGIDLAGGTNLVYQIDVDAAKKDGKNLDINTVEQLVQAIGKRLNPSGAEEITIRRVGRDRIEVIIPGADKDIVEQKKRLITRLGSLEFAILANARDHASIISRANQLPDGTDDLRDDKLLIASWRTVADGKNVGQNANDQTQLRVVKRRNDKGELVDVQQFLVVHETPDKQVTGKLLQDAGYRPDQQGRPAVSFRMTTTGSIRLDALTAKYAPDPVDKFERRLAILLDGKVYSAPNLRDRLSGGGGEITGDFDRKEVDELAGVLNAGALEVPLIPTPVSEFTISPLLGADVQQKGLLAIALSAAAVFIFMAVYYMVSGLVADMCLVLNLIMVVGAMAFIDATFTLPGLAGLVLTIGMAVDANVLIYERFREEMARGASMRLTIQNGFDKALSAIVDGNVTTLITAVILFMIGTDAVKGFAVSLFIGLSASMFAILVFGRICFDIIERKRLVTSLSMMPTIKLSGVDFLGMRVPAVLFSVVVIAAGMFALVSRGKDNLDIDFTGGTMVTLEFQKAQETAVVREKLDAKFPSAVSLEELRLNDESATAGTRFRIRTSLIDREEVRKLINESFADPETALTRVQLSFGDITPVTADDSKTIRIRPGTNIDKFTGGHRVPLTFTGPVAEATVAEYLAEQLKKFPGKDSQPRYDSAIGMVLVDGVSADGQPTTGKFTELVARVAPDVSNEDLAEALKALATQLANEPIFDEFNSFTTSVAAETQQNALLAILLSLVAIVVYIWFRFEKLYYGFAAVAALTHDALVVLGSVALGAWLAQTPIGPILGLEDFKINMGFIAAILTIIGYSLNDTIVIFDRIREIRGKNPNVTYDMINLSVNQTMSRTILTATTVLIVVVILYIFGGEGIHTFAYSFIIGTIAGTYSTIFIANPVLYWLVSRQQAKSAPAKVTA
ncbi:protein translocase subunit SecDF [Planctopirus hydrillae]|uniref:Multifunctional fusion protein n=1 Tax=Planctopirus hydrillae TaxID=1841610 RepID=A0A1C3E637_9PLAN|nr:protein translocase subunit SecDF [Planctopirus hydrillae]ODA28673.1 preprotein translocase subunit SecD [Planctopirus hydrillae]